MKINGMERNDKKVASYQMLQGYFGREVLGFIPAPWDSNSPPLARTPTTTTPVPL